MENENPQAAKAARVCNTDKLLGARLSEFPWLQAETVPDKATGALRKPLY